MQYCWNDELLATNDHNDYMYYHQELIFYSQWSLFIFYYCFAEKCFAFAGVKKFAVMIYGEMFSHLMCLHSRYLMSNFYGE